MKLVSLLTAATLSFALTACDNGSSNGAKQSVTTKNKHNSSLKAASLAQEACLDEANPMAMTTGLNDTDEITFTWKLLSSDLKEKSTTYSLNYYVDWDMSPENQIDKNILGETIPVLLGRDATEIKPELSLTISGQKTNEYIGKASTSLDDETTLYLSFDLIKTNASGSTEVVGNSVSLNKLKETNIQTLLLRSAAANTDISITLKRGSCAQ